MFRVVGFLFGAAAGLLLLMVVFEIPMREHVVAVKDKLIAEFLPATDRNRRREVSSPVNMTDIAIASLTSTGSQPGTTSIEIEKRSMPQNPTPGSPPVSGATTDAAPTVVQPKHESAEEQPRDDEATTDFVRGPGQTAAYTPAGHAQLWHPVWWTFRSELSAKGFANQMNRLTGQHFRVRQTDAWSYQVELAYTDMAERNAILNQIHTETGMNLQVPGS